MKQSWISFASLLVVFCLGSRINAENIVFPAVAGVVDITKAPYNADKTGKTDCAAIFNLALENERSQGTWGNTVIYVPNGTYLLKSGISWRMPPYTVGPHMIGQSKERTVLLLADSTFRSSTQAGVVVQTGGGVAQCFNRGLFNLTVNTGKGNPGAIGVFWYSNNEGLMSDVDIVSGDNLGVAGLRIGTVEEGPAMARRVHVKGFAYGVWSSANLNSVTLSEIFVEGQRIAGVLHQAQSPIFIDSLTSINSVPAVMIQYKAELVLINAYLIGGRPDTAAIVNQAMLFARNIVTSGYKQAITSTSHTVAPPTGPVVGEWSSHGIITQFDSPQHSLNLPIKRPPEPAWEQDVNKWADVSKYTTGRTDAAAFQAAIDDATKTVVVFPRGRDYNITGDVVVRGNIKMIISVGAQFTGNGTISVTDVAGSPPVVKFMKMLGPQPGTSPYIVHKSSRTVIVESMGLQGQGMGAVHQGTGDLFVTDQVSPIRVTNPSAHAWLWHYNAEGGTYQLDVQAGTVWIFGWKDEGSGSSGSMTGGKTEILGFINYGGDATNPQFVVSNASVSFAMAIKCIYGSGYTTIVRETRGGTTKNLLGSANPLGYPTQYDLPLYSGFDFTDVKDKPAVQPAAGNALSLEALSLRQGAMAVSWRAPGMATVACVNTLGRTLWTQSGVSGRQAAELKTAQLPNGSYRLVLRSGGRQMEKSIGIVH